jgi:hypothetical protein
MKNSRAVITFAMAAVLVLTALPFGVLAADPDTVGPITTSPVLDPNPATVYTIVTVSATVDDTTTGASNIQSAEFNVDGGAWVAMDAVDAAFDSPTEAVTGSFTAPPVGLHVVCVQGTDAFGNVGDPACVDLSVDSIYVFDGFKSPIKMNKDNKAKAGRTVPVKWKLFQASDGSKVSDFTSFVALKTYEVDCTTLEGDISTAVVENSAGKSTLKYQGNGKWRFNWKTPKLYKGTCRMMFVEFSDGLISPQVLFRFKAK